MAQQLINDIPDELKIFIVNIVNSYTAWDILTFFYDTPGTIRADADEVASSIGRDITEVSPVLQSMNVRGILCVTSRDDRVIYAPSQGGSSYQDINRFLNYTSTRQGRLKTIYMITSERCKLGE